MVESEGVVVKFSNGSMCQLTLRDPWKSLDALNLPESYPVTLFAYDKSNSKMYRDNGEDGGKQQSPPYGHDLSGRNVLLVEVRKERTEVGKGKRGVGRDMVILT